MRHGGTTHPLKRRATQQIIAWHIGCVESTCFLSPIKSSTQLKRLLHAEAQDVKRTQYTSLRWCWKLC